MTQNINNRKKRLEKFSDLSLRGRKEGYLLVNSYIRNLDARKRYKYRKNVSKLPDREMEKK